MSTAKPFNIRDYQHSGQEGIKISGDGETMLLDYFDWDQGGTKLMFTYAISLHGYPSVITGYSHESRRSTKETEWSDIPSHVAVDALEWIDANLSVQSNNQNLLQVLHDFHVLFNKNKNA